MIRFSDYELSLTNIYVAIRTIAMCLLSISIPMSKFESLAPLWFFLGPTIVIVMEWRFHEIAVTAAREEERERCRRIHGGW